MELYKRLRNIFDTVVLLLAQNYVYVYTYCVYVMITRNTQHIRPYNTTSTIQCRWSRSPRGLDSCAVHSRSRARAAWFCCLTTLRHW